ncbi:hypothetical protein LJB98_02440 [Bacteroidales bacterium OttesenSCG-928-M11]|nr:hypothetical protein [Bacteroidales bacterium OttesenSCG-928-M11]
MKKYNILIVLTILAIVMVWPISMQAQVTIGSLDEPQRFSVLELISNQAQGLRLPQMDTEQRDAMTGTDEFKAKKTTLAKGLLIYNTDTECIEYWNGEEWLSNCGNALFDPTGFTIDPAYNVYETDKTKIFTGAVFAGGTGDEKTRGTNVSYSEMDAGYFHYSGAKGQSIPQQEFTHASGIKVTIPATTLATEAAGGKGVIEIKVSGTPSASYAGKAFNIPIQLLTKKLVVRVNTGCGAYTDDKLVVDENNIVTNWLQFQCFNLGSDTNDTDPFTAKQSLHGHKYKWGRKAIAISATDDQADDAKASTWDAVVPPTDDKDWNMLTENPCPTGWKVPSEGDMANIIANNTFDKHTLVDGDAPATYNGGGMVGNALMFPGTALREINGKFALNNKRGATGMYWTSSISPDDSTKTKSCMVNTVMFQITPWFDRDKGFGYSVRCVVSQ